MKQFIQISFLLSLCPLAFAGPKQSKDLPPANSTAPVEVIVQFKTPPTKDDLKQLGSYGQVKKSFTSINAVDVTVSPSALAGLEANPNVRYISLNRTQRSFLDVTTASVSAGFAAQYGWDGTGVGVAVIDSGVALDGDLMAPGGATSRVVYSESFVADQTAVDAYRLGTHVAAISVSNG